MVKIKKETEEERRTRLMFNLNVDRNQQRFQRLTSGSLFGANTHLSDYYWPTAELVRQRRAAGDETHPEVENIHLATSERSRESRKKLPQHYLIKKHNKKHVDDYLETSGLYNFTVLPPDIQSYIWDMTGTTRTKYENDILGVINPEMVYDEVTSDMYQTDPNNPNKMPKYFDKKYNHPAFTSQRNHNNKDYMRAAIRELQKEQKRENPRQRWDKPPAGIIKGFVRPSLGESTGVEESKSIY